jgi:hypothetical protein
MRHLLTTAAVASLAAATLAFAPPAAAKVALDMSSVRLSAPYAKSPTSVTVVAKITQTSYADISLNVSLEGFRALKAFAYGKGACPRSVAQIDGPLTVRECGWEQEDGSAVLRLALGGTTASGKVKVTIASGALVAPSRAGEYSVSLSSWAFDTVKTRVSIASGPVK